MEVAGMQRLAPHDLVDHSQLGNREWLSHERGGQRRVLELGPGPLEAVGQDPGVIEREPASSPRPLATATIGQAERADFHPGGRGGVTACTRLG